MAPEVPAGLFTKQNWQLTLKIKVLDVFPSWWNGAERHLEINTGGNSMILNDRGAFMKEFHGGDVGCAVPGLSLGDFLTVG